MRRETLLVAGIQRREGQEGGGTETKGRELVVEVELRQVQPRHDLQLLQAAGSALPACHTCPLPARFSEFVRQANVKPVGRKVKIS